MSISSLAQSSYVIAGYTVGDDVSVRNWRLDGSQWSLGKSFNTQGPPVRADVLPQDAS